MARNFDPRAEVVAVSEIDIEILRFIEQFLSDNAYAPSVREIAEHIGRSSYGTVHQRRLTKMRWMGLVDWLEGQMRTIHLTEKGYKFLNYVAETGYKGDPNVDKRTTPSHWPTTRPKN
jgi:SOS-response transcriptional repressor LexA